MLNLALETQREIIGGGPSEFNWRRLNQMYESDLFEEFFRNNRDALAVALDDADTKLDHFGWPDDIRILSPNTLDNIVGGSEVDQAIIARRVDIQKRFLIRKGAPCFLDTLKHCTQFGISSDRIFVVDEQAKKILDRLQTNQCSINSLELNLGRYTSADAPIMFSRTLNLVALFKQQLRRLHINLGFYEDCDDMLNRLIREIANEDDLVDITDARMGIRDHVTFDGVMGMLLESPFLNRVSRLELAGLGIQHTDEQRALFFGSSVARNLDYLCMPVTSTHTLDALADNCTSLTALSIDNQSNSGFVGSDGNEISVSSLGYKKYGPMENPNADDVDILLQSFRGVKRLVIDTNKNVDIRAIFERNSDIEELELNHSKDPLIRALFASKAPNLKRLKLSAFNLFLNEEVYGSSSLWDSLEYIDISGSTFGKDSEPTSRNIMLRDLVIKLHSIGRPITLVVNKAYLEVIYYSLRHILDKGRVKVYGI